ncbi:MAG: CheR family methyltransferase [Planctomycetota bacterium]
MTGFDDIEALLREWLGLDAATVGRAAVERAVRGRMKAAGLGDPAAFARLLRADLAERDLLVEDVIVAESWFFRDRQVFEFVTDFAVTRAAVPGHAPVRILCAPAAGGEEPYSVAMALFEAGLTAAQFTIDAIDISRRALERAAAGRYSANAFRNADLAFRDRWFTCAGAQSVLAERVRNAVRLEWANVLDPAFAAGRPAYDVVFCRNLLIYLTAEARRGVEAQLDRLLAADGLLVLGAAEPPIMQGDWIPAGTASVFALRRGVHAGPRPAASGPVQPPAARPARPPRPAAEPALPRQPAPAGSTPADLEAVLAEAGRLANEGRFAEAIDHCERQRAALPPAPELFFLMGMLHQSAGDLDRAEGCFHKTLYLDGNHEEAHLSLALLARRRGDETMAEKYRQSAARAAARKEATP